MNKARISLSFDDGRGDNLDVIQNVLIPLSIPVTLNVTTGYVDGSCPADMMPTPKPPVTLHDVQLLGANPLVEIAMHGDRHLNTEDDIALGRQKLLDWLKLPETHAFGFASPGSGLSVKQFVESERPLFTKEISYLRTSLRICRMFYLRTLCRKAGRVFHIPLLYKLAYADTLMDSCPDRVIYSIPVMKDTSLAQVLAIIDLAIRRKKALTLMFHSVLEDTAAEDNWSWSRGDFCRLCDCLSKWAHNGDLQLCTTQQLYDSLRG